MVVSENKKKIKSPDDELDQLKLLFESCAVGDAELVSELVDSKIGVDNHNEDDVTALQIASAHGQDGIVKLLIMKGAALEKSNGKKWTSLLQAARQGHSNVVATLLQNHADVNARTKLGANAMLLASRKGDVATCKLLYGAGIDPTGQQSGDPCNPACDLTPIMVASMCGHCEMVKFFIENGEDVDQRSPSLGVSCLMVASLKGHENIVKLLVEHGANPDKTDINTKTALDFAASRNHRKIQAYLNRITSFKSKTTYEDIKLDIIEAAKKGNFLRVREILDKDIRQRDAAQPDDGATALMFAAVSGRLDIVQELVERGCDIDKQDNVSGWTALMQAVYHGKKAVAKYLVSAGANVHIMAKSGCTAFDMLTLLDEVDTDLYRILATATINALESSRSSTLKNEQMSDFGLLSSSFKNGKNSRQNLKDWWLKISDRFKHLRWGGGHGFNTTAHSNNIMSSNDHESNPTTPGQSRSNKLLYKNMLPNDMITEKNYMEKIASISTINTLGAIKEMESPVSIMSTDDELDPMRDSFMYTMGNLNSPIGSTLKMDIPLFLPPPASHCQSTAVMPLPRKNHNKKSTGPGRPIPKNGFVQNYFPSATRNRKTTSSSPADSAGAIASGRRGFVASGSKSHTFARQTTTTDALTNSSVSPSTSSGSDELRRGLSNQFPSSQCHNQLTLLQGLNRSKVNSSASSSTGTLTAGSDGHEKTPDAKKQFLDYKNETENSSTLADSNGSSYYQPIRFLSNNASAQSRVASYVANPTFNQSNAVNLANSAEDLGSILQKLSLEKYQSVFEEQEVDMETFLVLTDSNLKELGIAHMEARNRLLSAIDRINKSKE